MGDCIFCKIASKSINATLVYENEAIVAFRDVNPQAPIHILVVPKRHVDRLSSLTEKEGGILRDLHNGVQEVVKKERLKEQGYRVVVNEGSFGGQTVDHLHFHILGGRPMAWPPG